MAKIETFRYGVLLPRGEEVPAVPLSLATQFEEPDLSSLDPSGYAADFCRGEEPLMLDALRDDELIVEGSGIVIVQARHDGREAYGVYCRYPVKLIKELGDQPESADDSGEYANEYGDFVAHHKAYLDPLHLALHDAKGELPALLAGVGEKIASYVLPGGASLTFRSLDDAKAIRSILKHFEPGLFSSKPSPLILDGPLELAKSLKNQDDGYIFACLIPVGEGSASLDLHELLVQFEEDENEEEASPDVSALVLPEEFSPRYYPFIDAEEREYVSVDWEEDLRIESQTADCCALLERKRDALGLVVGEGCDAPRGIDALYLREAFGSGSKRLVIARGDRAAKLFTSGQGEIALWVPGYGRKDFTQAVHQRPPLLAARRAMLSLRPYIPFGCVVDLM